NTDRQLKAMQMSINMLVMHNTDISIEERIDAGQNYIDAGGNGSERIYFEKLSNTYRQKILKNNGE
ncbi:MAG: hypothetical protein LBC07_00040, partial [Elusimicrobiota bacterium]|nr:hypothetical protein [Elusimicrobiota bacterium]